MKRAELKKISDEMLVLVGEKPVLLGSDILLDWAERLIGIPEQPTGIPAESRYGRDLIPEPKPLAQYLAEYVDHDAKSDGLKMEAAEIWIPGEKFLEQALEAYQSTENVTIKIVRVAG